MPKIKCNKTSCVWNKSKFCRNKEWIELLAVEDKLICDEYKIESEGKENDREDTIRDFDS